MNLYGPKQLAESIRTVRKNTIRIAEDINEDDFGFRPTPESRSVSELLAHIQFFSHFDRFLHEEKHVSTLEDFDFGKLLNDSEAEEKKIHAKAERVRLLKASGESWAEWVENLPELILAEHVVQRGGGASRTRFDMILGTMGHEMHHRGQLTVIERMLGVVPHFTRNRRPMETVSAKLAS